MTTTYRIAEVARRSGYSPPTLRYYEDIGLLPPAQRGENGYRVYDETTVDRLAFITRAKQLGCSLEEVTELARAWEGGDCAPVQQRLRTAIEAKVTEGQSRIAQLTAFVADLQHAAASLGSHTPDGPCDDNCGCTATPAAQSEASAVRLSTNPDLRPGDTPIACTLGASDVDRRIDEWKALLAEVQERTPIDGGLRLTFGPDAPIATMGRLAAAEQDCCRFFAFTLTVDQRGVALEVRAPADGQDVLAALFGSAG